MNKIILNTGVQNFIRNYSNPDILTVLLQRPYFPNIDNKELVEQIESRRKCKKKLPSWYETAGIYYPSKRAIEQSSSEITAAYKSNLITGHTLVDITGGIGIDSYFLSKKVDSLTYCEKQEELATIASHNFNILKADNIHVHMGDGIEYLKALKEKVDWVYMDPSRRKADEKRVFLLNEADPPLPQSLETIWSRSDRLMIKTSPWLDLSAGIQILKAVKQIHVVAVNNEVKELLWILEKGHMVEPIIYTIDIRKDENYSFSFKLSDEKEAISAYGPPAQYIYEPNAALMKSGAYSLLSQWTGLVKLHENTHLYTSDTLIEFPGKRFRLIEKLPYNPKKIRQLGFKSSNISTRNFPESAPALRKKFKLKDGGDKTLYFTKDHTGKLVVLLCHPAT